MVDKHPRVVLFVDMVAGEDDDILRLVATNDVEVLRHRVRGAAIPVFSLHPLLGGQQVNKFVHLFIEKRPAALNMLHQSMRLILGDDADTTNT